MPAAQGDDGGVHCGFDLADELCLYRGDLTSLKNASLVFFGDQWVSCGWLGHLQQSASWFSVTLPLEENKLANQPNKPRQTKEGGDGQGGRKAELYSLMGEEHSVAHSQSDGQSGGQSICFITYYVLIYHTVNTSTFTMFPIKVES
ncbi:hypothetical protein STEG23_032944 [Scotinomys teguina]